MTNDKDYIIINIDEISGCFVEKSHSYKLPIIKLSELIKFIDNLTERKVKDE